MKIADNVTALIGNTPWSNSTASLTGSGDGRRQVGVLQPGA